MVLVAVMPPGENLAAPRRNPLSWRPTPNS